ncbi:MAG: hypothetical protein AAGI23_05250 [Bacteroidota bacterium]
MLKKLEAAWQKQLFQHITKQQLKQRFLLGQHIAHEKRKSYDQIEQLQQAEFKVFSQWGDDGIIQYLVDQVDIVSSYFVEFGVENYLESNTRFLLMNNNWSGLVMDGSDDHIQFIKRDDIYWRYDLEAKAAFITAENINELLAVHVPQSEIGLLHIDIDGNDYWIWKAIEVIQPTIVVMEYNSVFGIERAITVPYQADFVRTQAHSSNLYAGVSLLALCDLATEKGYALVGSNSAGNNAYFVRQDRLGKLKTLSPEEGYVVSKFREARGDDGELLALRGAERLQLIKGMPIYNTRTQQIEKL